MVQIEDWPGSMPDPSRGGVLRSRYHVAGAIRGSGCFPGSPICSQPARAGRVAHPVLRGRTVDRTERASPWGIVCDGPYAPPTDPRTTGILAHSESSGHGPSDPGKEFARLEDRLEEKGGVRT